MEYYLTLKKKEILPFEMTWMNLGNFILSEKDSHRRTNTALFHLHEVSKTIKLIEIETIIVVVRGWG